MRLEIFKIGGNVIENQSELTKFLQLFSKIHSPKILVHGGGKKATQLLPKLGISPKMVNGRRITNAPTLEVVTMVYGGLVNKNIVAQLQAFGNNALGLSGADANTISAVKRPVTTIDYGFAGDVTTVNSKAIIAILQAGFTPVFCALTHDNNGQLLNTNADTISAALAVALSKQYQVTLNYCFELNGVLKNIEDKTSVIPKITLEDYATLKANGTIANGMLPKIHNCFEALKQGVTQVCIGNYGLFDKEKKNYTQLVL